MSDQGFLKKMLDGAEVKWVPLGDVIQSTRNIKWSDVDRSHQYIDLTSVDIKTKAVTETKEIKADTAPSRAQKLVETDDLIFATTRPAQQRYCLIGPELSGEVASTGYCVLRAKRSVVLPKWLLHWISTTDFKLYVEEHQSGAAYPAISDGKVKAFKIPIPCPEDPEKSLAIQAEIVRILDAFTELTAELTAELKARKKQYNHYRDQLLSFEDGDVECKPLVEVADFRRGTAITKKQTTEGDIPVVANGPVPNYSHGEHNREGETVVVARSGAYAGLVSYWNEPIFLTDAFSVHPHPGVMTPRFVYYLLQNKQDQIHAMKKGAGVPHVRVKEVELYDVPVPSLAEQDRIVAILDKFDTLTSSLSEGLPREIKLRQQQYKYYRDLLLSFPESEEAA